MAESLETNITENTLNEEPCPATDVTKDSKMVEFPEMNDVTEEILQLSYEKKLEIYKTDAQTLLEFTLLKGLSSKQIRSCLSPILGDKQSIGKRIVSGSSHHMTILSFIVAILAVLYSIPLCNQFIEVHLRLISMKTLQYYDWTKLYDVECLIDNPYLPTAKNFTEQDCDGCLDLRDTGQIDRIGNADVQKLTDDYLNAEIPFVIIDAVKDWKKDEDGELVFSLEKLNETLQENPILTTATEHCEFFSTIEGQNNISEFVTALNTEDFPDKFHVAWENCDANAAKIFRVLGRRPYFIPPMAESSVHNQVVVAKGKFDDEEVLTLPQQIDSASWLVVLEGEMKITLQPNHQCEPFGCTAAKLKIGKGEAVVVPTRIWQLNYSPISESYTLAFASTLIWDDVV